MVDLVATFSAMHENGGEGPYKGNYPSIFTGDKDKAEIFISEFNQYWKLNSSKEKMVLLYLCIILALSYYKGEKVQDWVNTQMALLDTNANRHGRDIERLWDSFLEAFKGAFVSTT
jgi:hypothetical protein